MATTVSPSFTGSIASFIQGINVDSYSRFGRAIAPLLGRSSKNNYYLSSSTGTTSLDNTQTFFDDSRKGPALMTSGTVGTVRVAITDQKQRVIVTPSYFVEQREFGYDQYFTATEPVLLDGVATGQLKFAPFKEMGKWNSVHYIESPDTMQWPVVLDSPSAMDPFEFNGVIEPLTIRKKITESSTFLDTPEDPEPHSIRGSITSGEMFGDSLGKVFPSSNFYNPADTSLGLAPWENLGDAITYDGTQDHVLPMPIIGDIPPSPDPFNEKNEVDDLINQLQDKSLYYYLTGSSIAPYRLGQTWSSSNNAVAGTIYTQESIDSLQAWWRLNTDMSVSNTVAKDSYIYNRTGSFHLMGYRPTVAASTPSSTIAEDSSYFDGDDSSSTKAARVSIGKPEMWNAIIGNDSGNGGTSQMTFAGWYNQLSGSTGYAHLLNFCSSEGTSADSNAGGIGLKLYTIQDSSGNFTANKFRFATRWSGDASIATFAFSNNFELSAATDTWIHFVVTYDATTGSNLPQFYANGEFLACASETFSSLAKAETWGGISNVGDSNSMACYIGDISRWSDSTRQFAFTGNLCDIAIWNKSLTADQIRSLYRAKSHTLYKVKQETLRTTLEGIPTSNSKSAGVGFTYDNNPIGIDSIAFGGLKK